jgi:hypothetical protein
MRQGQPFYSGGTWERMTPDAVPDSAATSLAHGWASAPTSALSKYVLGVRPIEPGYQTWLVEPQPGDLGWAAGTVPTPYGPIAVSWQLGSRGLRLEVWVPAGTRGTVGVPVSGSNPVLMDNGRTVAGVKPPSSPTAERATFTCRACRPAPTSSKSRPTIDKAVGARAPASRICFISRIGRCQRQFSWMKKGSPAARQSWTLPRDKFSALNVLWLEMLEGFGQKRP